MGGRGVGSVGPRNILAKGHRHVLRFPHGYLPVGEAGSVHMAVAMRQGLFHHPFGRARRKTIRLV